MHPTAHILCVPQKHFNSVYTLFPYLPILTVQQLGTQRSCGALQASVSQAAWPWPAGRQWRQRAEAASILSLTLLLHGAVIVNYTGAIKLPWLHVLLSLLCYSSNHRFWLFHLTIKWLRLDGTSGSSPVHLEPGPYPGTFWVAPRRQIAHPLLAACASSYTHKKAFPDAQSSLLCFSLCLLPLSQTVTLVTLQKSIGYHVLHLKGKELKKYSSRFIFVRSQVIFLE